MVKDKVPSELSLFELYAERCQLDPDRLMAGIFHSEESYLGNVYIFNEDDRVSFSFDDVTAIESPIEDNSIDTIIYMNVHYQLSENGKKAAALKLFNKLKTGGKMYFVNTNEGPRPPEFLDLFGEPEIVQNDLAIYQKPTEEDPYKFGGCSPSR